MYCSDYGEHKLIRQLIVVITNTMIPLLYTQAACMS